MIFAIAYTLFWLASLFLHWGLTYGNGHRKFLIELDLGTLLATFIIATLIVGGSYLTFGWTLPTQVLAFWYIYTGTATIIEWLRKGYSYVTTGQFWLYLLLYSGFSVIIFSSV